MDHSNSDNGDRVRVDCPYVLRFELDGLPKMPNNGHGHWRADHERKKKWKEKVILLVGYRRPAVPLEKACVKLTRFSSVQPDYDNLVASFKPIIDGLRYAKVLKDDRMTNFRPECEWIKAPQGLGKIRVEVTSQ